MANGSLGLRPALLARAFPFHFAIGTDGKVLQTGAVLRRLAPGLTVGSAASASLSFLEPKIPFDCAAIREHANRAFTLEILSSGLRLRGEIAEMPDHEALIFLGSPWLTKLEQMERYGLGLADFALHDPISDYLPSFTPRRLF
jgi:two-component system NtrC family sensor kinase